MPTSTLTMYRLKNLPTDVAAARAGGNGQYTPLPIEIQALGFDAQANVGDTVPLAADELGKDEMYDPFLKHADGWHRFVEVI